MTIQGGSDAHDRKASDLRLAAFVAILMALLGIVVVLFAYPRLNELQLKVISVLISASGSFAAFAVHYHFRRDALDPRGRLMELIGFLGVMAALLVFWSWLL